MRWSVSSAHELRRVDRVGAAQPALLDALPGAVLDRRSSRGSAAARRRRLRPRTHATDRRLRLDRFAPALQVELTLLEVLEPRGRRRALLGLLGLAGRAGEHALRPDVDVGELDPWPVSRNSRIWLECAIPRDLSTYSTRLCSPLPSIVLTQQPGVDERGDLLVGPSVSLAGVQAREQRGHALAP